MKEQWDESGGAVWSRNGENKLREEEQVSEQRGTSLFFLICRHRVSDQSYSVLRELAYKSREH